jgi:hypothetical protein
MIKGGGLEGESIMLNFTADDKTFPLQVALCYNKKVDLS